MWGNTNALAMRLNPLFPNDASTYDVFISYAHTDAQLAGAIKSTLEKENLICFMAEKEVQIAAEWEKQIRDALLGAKTILLLLTPRSSQRPWVLLEAGAAWVLDKPVIPALAYVSASDLVEPIRRYQARNVEIPNQIDDLATELAARIRSLNAHL